MEKSGNDPIYGVICCVVSCCYNDKHGQCLAKQIEIGPMRAANCTETVCATYKPDPENAEGRIF